ANHAVQGHTAQRRTRAAVVDLVLDRAGTQADRLRRDLADGAAGGGAGQGVAVHAHPAVGGTVDGQPGHADGLAVADVLVVVARRGSLVDHDGVAVDGA